MTIDMQKSSVLLTSLLLVMSCVCGFNTSSEATYISESSPNLKENQLEFKSSAKQEFLDIINNQHQRQYKDVGKDDIVIPLTIKKWMLNPDIKRRPDHFRPRKPVRRNGALAPNAATINPSLVSSSTPTITMPASFSPSSFNPMASSSNQESESISGVFAKWNPKINLTWPPTMTVGSGTSEYPDYQGTPSHHHDHYDHHFEYKSAPSVQYIPIPYCHHEHHRHGKKKEISLVWPLIILGLIFLPLLVGALLLPLAFLFISNIIQLLSLLQRIPLNTTAAPTAGKRRKKRSAYIPFNEISSFLSSHPEIMKEIDFLTDQVDCGLQKFLKYLYDE